MPVIETPSIWDYIANAGGQAISSYKEAKDKVRQDAAQNAGLLTQLFGAGAIDASTLQPAVSKIPGMGQVKVQPNAAERTRTPGTAENIAQTATTKGNEATIRKADIVDKWTKGTPISEEEALIAGLPTQQDMALAKSAKVDASLDQAGKQYVDAQFLAKGGRIRPHEAIDIAANAYQQYVKDYQAAGLGTLTPAQLQNAQRYFASRAMDRLNEQRRLDVEAIAANRDRSGIQPADRMFAQLTTLMENNRKTLEDFTKANPGIEVISSKYQDESTAPPALKGQIVRYRRLQQRENDLQNAQSQLAMGVVPKNFAGLLDSQVTAGTPTAATPAKPDPIVAIKAAYKAKQLTADQIRSSKLITQQQKDEILGSNITLKK